MENSLEDNLDPFKDIDPVETADEVSNNLCVINKMYISQQNLDDDADDSDREDDDCNIFMYLLTMLKETIRPDTNSLSSCLLRASFFTVRYFEDKK